VHTHDDNIYRASIASRGKNEWEENGRSRGTGNR